MQAERRAGLCPECRAKNILSQQAVSRAQRKVRYAEVDEQIADKGLADRMGHYTIRSRSETAAILNITREEVRQAERSAFYKIQKAFAQIQLEARARAVYEKSKG